MPQLPGIAPTRTLDEWEFNQIRQRVLDAAPKGLSESDFQRYIGPAMAQAIGEAENTPKQDGSALGRFVSNAAEMLNPVAIGSAILNPSRTAQAMLDASADQYAKARQAASEGRYSEALGHGLGVVPIVGTIPAVAGEQMASGDVAGGLGKAAGFAAPIVVPKAVGAAVRAVPDSVATSADALAAQKIADVMAPKVGPNKLRFGNDAAKVAPTIAQEMAAEGAPLTRAGLKSRYDAKLDAARDRLDAAQNAVSSTADYPTQPVIDALKAKRAELVAEARKGQTQPGNAPLQREDQLKGIDYADRAREIPIGKDVEPAPNAARIAAIDQVIKEVSDLGKVAPYESLRMIREAWDKVAKVQYHPSMTQDFLKQQGSAAGAADATSALRESLARFEPDVANANQSYSLYRRATDVLRATEEVERTRPTQGRQLVAKILGTTMGAHEAGAAGAVAGFALGPAIDAALQMAPTMQLKMASGLTKLAAAIRAGDTGMALSLMDQIKQMGKVGAIGAGTTSPNESQTQTIAPGLQPAWSK